ncbi:acidic leucine-rich nuclear phosphoprotein 32-related protein-like [Vigna umbellata]|uniref:acidic leucine-rich nuclear phosphoprotein 32-related protein-like n=1 Tax=Vigna umbellata TaxID=87088 RepID=UPI001F5ED43D|nr:acidic leucine-rich nuclear phosphoprotein 32-related protein-like [Vigna umbellata]XP_047177774.1 acidic leucine-rich nuclear phosphoprotein 32-related protein-like [Vigna umbellata]
MNMMKVANYLGKVNLYVVHGVDEPTIVENDENEILYLCEGPVESGEGSGVGGEAHVEGGDEIIRDVVQGVVEVENCDAVDVENEDVWEDDKEDSEDVEVAVEVQNEDRVEFESEEVVEVDNVDEVEVESDELVEVDIEDGGEVESEEELEVDIEDGGEVHSEQELEVEVDSDDEPGMDDLSGDEYVDADNHQETQQQCRGLSDDD